MEGQILNRSVLYVQTSHVRKLEETRIPMKQKAEDPSTTCHSLKVQF